MHCWYGKEAALPDRMDIWGMSMQERPEIPVRKRRSSCTLFILLGVWISLSVHTPGAKAEALKEQAGGVNFQTGETIHYRVEWNWIHVGDAFLTVLPIAEFDGTRAHHFSLTAKTMPVVDLIYKARRRVDSLVDLAMTRSLHFEKVDELDKDRHVVVYFDWSKQTAQYTRVHKRRQPIPVPSGTFDPLGVFYAFRHRDLKEGAVLKAPVTDGKRCVIAEARVLGKEIIRIASGTYDTYVVEPELGRVILGVFKKREDAKLRIWVTADELRIPVRVESEVAVGRFVAEMVSRRVAANAAMPQDFRMAIQ